MSFAIIPNENKQEEVIILKNSVYHSLRGEYFFGQTYLTTFGGRFQAWGGLFNPFGSNVNLYLNTFTISNFSMLPITAEIWLSSNLFGNAEISPYVASGNQSMSPPPIPKVQIQSASNVSQTPTGGTYSFTRRIEPQFTLIRTNYQGKYIFPPGSSFALYLISQVEMQVQANLAFEWWEEKIK